MFEELYLQTQVGGLQDLPGSLLESKNLGSNEALSTQPFCVMCKRVRATLAPKVTRRTGSFKRPPQAKAEAGSQGVRQGALRSQRSKVWPFPSSGTRISLVTEYNID